MGFGELFLLAVGLSMDAFAVSVCKGLSVRKAGVRESAACGLWFGGFQALVHCLLASSKPLIIGLLLACWRLSVSIC